MKNYRHHVWGSAYSHSVRVAYLCYKHYMRFGGKASLRETLRGALLHDYYLYDWREEGMNGLVHGVTHARRALENALKKYPDLTEAERDMIERHMFPLNPIPPKTGAGMLVCFYDKIAALGDYFTGLRLLSERWLGKKK